jgi:PST family polysaccharide transporter
MSEEQGGLRNSLLAMRRTSLASLLVVVLGMGTNKIISMFAGPAGAALVTLYRTLITVVTTIVQLGVLDVVVRRISTAANPAVAREALSAAVAFFVIEAAVTAVVALFGAGPIAHLMFGRDFAAHVFEVRLVLATTVGVLALQMITAVLNGRLLLRASTQVGMVTAATTLAVAYPLVELGPSGLALLIGGTCFVGAGLGFYHLLTHEKLSATELLGSAQWRGLRRVLPFSVGSTVNPLVITASALAIQTLIGRHYGIEPLGLYGAASLLETTAVMVLTSSMRSYFLPMLGRLEGDEQSRFIARILLMLTLVVFGGVVLLVVCGPLAMRILFSGRFIDAAGIAAVLGLSIVGQLWGWCYSMVLLNRGDFGSRLVLDSIWAVLRIGGTWYCVAHDRPIIDIAWVHAASYTITGILYASVVAVRYGRRLVDAKAIALGLATGTVLVLFVTWRIG